MKKLFTLLLVSMLLLIALPSLSQVEYIMELNKTGGTHYKYPATVLAAAYKYKFVSAEIGFRTNWQEYYTFVYTGIGAEYRKAILLQANIGTGWMFSLPMIDRKYNPETGETVVTTPGYTTKTIFLGCYGARAGYRIFHVGKDSGVWLFGVYNKTGKFDWSGFGFLLSSN